MFKVLTLYQGNAYFNFIESLHSESTKRNYAYGLKHFLTHHKLKDPEEILSISLDALEEMIKKYLVYLTQVHKSNGMARVNLAAIRHFCKMNKVKLDWDLIYAFKGKARTKAKDKAYEHEDLYKLLSVCTLRQKLIVLIYSSTGIRSAALPPLKLKNITKIPEQGIYKFNIYDDDDKGVTFGDKINLSNTTDALSTRVEIDSDADSVVVTWWETNETSDVPVMRVSDDNGKTFGETIFLAANGTISGE